MNDGRIDVHAHYLAPTYVEALHRAERWLLGGIPVPPWSPQLALEFMDAHGIATQLLSVSDPGVEFVEDDAAAPLARACNDYAAQLMAEHPDRFGAFAVLAPRDIEEARGEAARALDRLGMHGVGLLSSYGGHYLGDPLFAPLLADLDERGAWVFVHPTSIPEKPSLGVPDFIAEYPFDTTRTIVSLLVNGVFERHRRIRWHFAHGGGTIPMLRLRLSGACAAAKEFGPILGLPEGAELLSAESPDRAFRSSYFDTALIADPPALRAVAGIAGAERVVFGSDWPFAGRLYAPSGDPQPALDEVFSPQERTAIDRGNAAAGLALVER